MSTVSAIPTDVMEQSKIDIGKTIDTKVSEDITITRCDTKVWIKTIFMENMDDLLKHCTHCQSIFNICPCYMSKILLSDAGVLFMLGPPPTNHPHTPAANLSLPWTSPLEIWCCGFTSQLHPTLTLSTQEHAGLQPPAKYNTVPFARHRWLPGP